MKNSARAIGLGLAVALLLAGCKDTPVQDGGIPGPVQLIRQTDITLHVGKDTVLGDEQVTITCTYKPILRSKGHVELLGAGDLVPSKWCMDSPVVDTLIRPKDTWRSVSFPKEFGEGEATVQEWKVRLLTWGSVTYLFDTHVVIDSVFLPEKGAFYGAYSREVKAHFNEYEIASQATGPRGYITRR